MSMLGLYISLGVLGLSAVDPVGIGIMPLLLGQKRPYLRAGIFLSGSFVSLMAMGLVFARGFGELVLRFESGHRWLVPTIEVAAGIVLLLVAITVYLQLRAHKAEVGPSKRLRGWLHLNNWQLFLLGAAIVAVQSIVDVVFVVAMIHAGQARLSNLLLILAIFTYAITALLIQLAVVGAFWLAPTHRKEKLLDKVHQLLARYANQTVIGISLLLGIVLILLALI